MSEKIIKKPDITVVMTDEDGKEHRFTARLLTRKDIKVWNDLNTPESANFYGKLPIEDQMPTLMASIYGGTMENYF